MNKKAESNWFQIIFGIILLVAVGLSITQTFGSSQQTLVTGVQEQETKTTAITTLQNFELTYRPVVSSIVVTNATDSTGLGFVATGLNKVIQVSNGTGVINITYTGKPDAYQDSSITRTIMGYLSLFVVLGALFFVVKGSGVD